MAERLESVEKETQNLPEEDRSEEDGLEEEEAVVDLTASDDDEEEPETLSQRATCVIQPRSDSGEASKPHNILTTIRKPNGECLLPGTYDIILCVDFIETTG